MRTLKSSIQFAIYSPSDHPYYYYYYCSPRHPHFSQYASSLANRENQNDIAGPYSLGKRDMKDGWMCVAWQWEEIFSIP
jgi:hypothetical protein